MSYDFNGRTALITGGAGGIGAAAARLLLADGARVATLDLKPAQLEGVLAIEGDVSSSEDIDAAVAAVESELGPLQIAICAAGVSGDSLRTVDVSDAEWHRVFAINCDGVFFANRAAARVMAPRGYGRIVNIASIAGKEGNPMAAAYSSSKAAVIAITKGGRQGPRRGRRAGQLHRAGGDRHRDAGRHERGARRLHDREDPDEADRPPRGGGGADRVPGLGGVQLLDRRGVRPLRRAGDLLNDRRAATERQLNVSALPGASQNGRR
jgi:short chain dehydrogenase